MELAITRPSKPKDMGVPETVIPCPIVSVWPSIAAPFDDIVKILASSSDHFSWRSRCTGNETWQC